MPQLAINRVRQYDPTRTLTLRNRFARESNRRFKRIASEIEARITRPVILSLGTREAMLFMAWFREQTRTQLLEALPEAHVGAPIQPAWKGLYTQSWINPFISKAYLRGMDRASAELSRRGIWSLSDSIASPEHVDRVGVIYADLHGALRDIVADMEVGVSGILASGVEGALLVRQLRQEVSRAARRFEAQARTAIVRAYNWAAGQRYRNYGIRGVRVMAELITAGDDRVCSVCSSLEGQVLTLDEAEQLIPVHLHCRCFLLPVT